jgi:hypothetical protein
MRDVLLGCVLTNESPLVTSEAVREQMLWNSRLPRALGRPMVSSSGPQSATSTCPALRTLHPRSARSAAIAGFVSKLEPIVLPLRRASHKRPSAIARPSRSTRMKAPLCRPESLRAPRTCPSYRGSKACAPCNRRTTSASKNGVPVEQVLQLGRGHHSHRVFQDVPPICSHTGVGVNHFTCRGAECRSGSSSTY